MPSFAISFGAISYKKHIKASRLRNTVVDVADVPDVQDVLGLAGSPGYYLDYLD
jgi:hypothetical protein